MFALKIFFKKPSSIILKYLWYERKHFKNFKRVVFRYLCCKFHKTNKKVTVVKFAMCVCSFHEFIAIRFKKIQWSNWYQIFVMFVRWSGYWNDWKFTVQYVTGCKSEVSDLFKNEKKKLKCNKKIKRMLRWLSKRSIRSYKFNINWLLINVRIC